MWENGPNGSKGDVLFGKLQVGDLVHASIGTVETQPYYIESPNGKFTHPESGMPANKAESYSFVRFPYETVDGILRRNGLTRKQATASADALAFGAPQSAEPLATEGSAEQIAEAALVK